MFDAQSGAKDFVLKFFTDDWISYLASSGFVRILKAFSASKIAQFFHCIFFDFLSKLMHDGLRWGYGSLLFTFESR